MMVFRTVLIVDSEHTSRVLLRKLFEEAGHFVISAGTGAEAILMLEKLSKPAIVLAATDAAMVSGENFLVRFHSFDKYSKVPAIQLKRSSADPDLPGICGSLAPPITSENVLATLKHCE